MTEMFGSKEEFACPRYSSRDDYIGILSAYNARIPQSKAFQNGISMVSGLISQDRAKVFNFFLRCVNTVDCIHRIGIVRRLEMSNGAILCFKPFFEIALGKEPRFDSRISEFVLFAFSPGEVACSSFRAAKIMKEQRKFVTQPGACESYVFLAEFGFHADRFMKKNS